MESFTEKNPFMSLDGHVTRPAWVWTGGAKTLIPVSEMSCLLFVWGDNVMECSSPVVNDVQKLNSIYIPFHLGWVCSSLNSQSFGGLF